MKTGGQVRNQESKLNENESNREKLQNRKKIFYVDFAKIENEAQTNFEREVAKRIASEPSPYDVLVVEERKEILSEAIERAPLSDQERVVMNLILDGYRHVEIEEEMGLRGNAVSSYRKRAMEKLKKYLISKYGDETDEILRF